MKDTLIATWQNYSILRTTPALGGRAFYFVARDGRPISRTFNQKKNAIRALKSLQGIQPYPILDARIRFLEKGIETYSHCAQ